MNYVYLIEMKRTITFNVEGHSIDIQASGNESMDDVISKLSNKTGTDLSSSTFLYQANTLQRSSTFESSANKYDKERNQMTILVYSNEDNNSDDKEIKALTKSKEIICPICKEICKINIYDYKISLYSCKNNHKTSNILFNDFDKSQMIDESRIICSICNENNKSCSYNNEFYYCKICNKNICTLCKSEHSKSHYDIINYEQNNFLCHAHNRPFNSYCNDCKKDICMYCEKEHFNHYSISYGTIFLNSNDLKNRLMELRLNIDKVKKNINEINGSNDFIQYFENYFKISEFIINFFNDKKVNFYILNNINIIHQKNKEFSDEFKIINNESDVNLKSKMVTDILKKIEEKKNDDNDKIYPEEQQFLQNIYESSYSHHGFFQHSPHHWYGPHGPPHWDSSHGPPHWDGPHGPPHWDGPHGPPHWDGPHGPPHWDGPHRRPPHWDGPHGPHEWFGHHHGWHGPNDCKRPPGPHGDHT